MASCTSTTQGSLKMLSCCPNKRYCSNFVVNSILERATRPSRQNLFASSTSLETTKEAQQEDDEEDTMWKKYFSIKYRRRRNRKNVYRTHSESSSGSSAYTDTSYSIVLSETCGLSISELEAMAARQARQLETQEQLLAAKAQRLRFLKSGGEAERLQRLREKVASQEERLRKLRALRGKVQSNRNANSVLSSDLESLRAVFNEKEKELSLAVAKVDELTRQLEDLRRSNKDQPPNGQQSAAAAELEKLRRELMYRQKLREAQATRVAAQRAALNQRQEETMRVDRRIAELQERLHRKRLLNQQLAVTLKHEDNADDFVSVPNKNDPKYQTLPYNAKLFAPFANKHEQDQFEKSMQQMQIIQADHHHGSHQVSSHHQNNQHNQLHQNHIVQQQQQHQTQAPSAFHHQQQNGSSSGGVTSSNYQSHNYNSGSGNTSNGTIEQINPNGIQSVSSSLEQHNNMHSNNSNGGNHVNNSSAATISSLQQLHHLLSISGLNQNAKSGTNQQQSYGNSNSSANNAAPSSVATTKATSSGVPNGLQTVHSTQANNNVSRGKAVPIIGNSGQSNNSNSSSSSTNAGAIPPAFPVIRPSSFYPTGAPPSSAASSIAGSLSSTSASSTVNAPISTNNGGNMNSNSSGHTMPLASSSRLNGVLNSQGPACNSNGNSLEISLTGTNSASLSSTSSNDTGFVSSGSSSSGSAIPASLLSQNRLQKQQQHQQELDMQQQHLKPALPPKPAKPTPPPRQAHDMFNYNMRSGSVEGMLQDRSDASQKSKPHFVKSNSVQPTSDCGSGQNVMALEKDPTNGNTVRVSINRRIEMPPAFLFPESDPPPSDLVPEHQHSTNSSSLSTLMSTFPSAGVERQHQAHSNAENTSNQHQQQSIQQQHQQQMLQLSPVSSASVDSVDAAPLLLHKGSAAGHGHQQQLLPEEYTLPDLFPPHPVSSQSVFSPSNGSSSGGSNNKGDHFMNINNQINSHHMHRNAQALIESLGQHSSQQILHHMSTFSQQHREANDENQMHGERNSKRTDYNANSAGNGNTVTSSQSDENSKASSGDSEPNSGFQLESNEAVNENESESCGNNINNNILLGERPSGATGLDRGKDHGSSEAETVTANKEEGNSNINNPPGIVIAAAVTTVPGVLRRVKKSNFKSNNKDHLPLGRRVSFDPLALLLDASLEGELELVVKTAGEVGNVSAANDEGITALHNAICAGHFDVVRFLVQFGCDVNAQDSDGWTPLHCAASCNNVSMVKFLVEHGACIFATTLSDHETAAEKCEEDEDGFGPCSEYLYSIQEKLGIMNGGVVYAVFEYDAQNSDELSFKEGDRLMILRKGDEYEREWWWASSGEKEGYVPRNLLGLYPRVIPQKRSDS